MTNGQSIVGSDRESDGASSSPLSLELLRERAIARRHRERLTVSWNVVRLRRQKRQMIAVCAGVLLLMGLAVYFEVERQPSPPPVDGAAPPSVAVTVGIA